MHGVDFFIHWIDVLAGLAQGLRESWRARRRLVVTREGSRFEVHAADAFDAPIVAAPDGAFPPDLLRRARRALVLLEWPAERIVARGVTLPAKAREFMPGVVDNQLDRLSPWPVAQILRGIAVAPSGRPDTLEIRVSIASRSEIESTCAELAARGLPVDRVVTRSEPPDAPPTILWSRSAQPEAEDRRRLRLVIGGGVLAHVAICAALGFWATSSATALQEESEQIAARASAIQRRAQAARSPQAIAALSPPEAAWVRKETSVSALSLLESLSQSLPDGAFLTDLQFEGGRLRIAGLADDAPPLIAALESAGELSDVRFSAPTTRGPDGKLFRFSIEAQVAASSSGKGE